MSNFPPYGHSSGNIKVHLDLSNYATKTNLKNITYADTSSFASKTNLAILRSEVDKLDTDKIKTVPADLAKLSNVVKNDVVKKTEYNTLKTKVDGIDTSTFATKTKFTADINTLDDKIDKVDKKIPYISGLATKSSLTNYLSTATFSSKVTELENKIPNSTKFVAKTVYDAKIKSLDSQTINNSTLVLAADIKNKNISDNLAGFVKKSDYATEIIAIKNDYVTNTSLTSKLNDLKRQHIATEVKSIDDKTKKNASYILGFESRLKQKEDIVDEVQRQNSADRGFRYYIDKNYVRYECRIGSFTFSNGQISTWKSTGIFNYLGNSNMNAIADATLALPTIENNGRINVKLSGNYFVQNKVIHPNDKNVVNIYVVYKLDTISSLINTD